MSPKNKFGTVLSINSDFSQTCLIILIDMQKNIQHYNFAKL